MTLEEHWNGHNLKRFHLSAQIYNWAACQPVHVVLNLQPCLIWFICYKSTLAPINSLECLSKCSYYHAVISISFWRCRLHKNIQCFKSHHILYLYKYHWTSSFIYTFFSNNSTCGIWLCHCRVAWHFRWSVNQGFNIHFLILLSALDYCTYEIRGLWTTMHHFTFACFKFPSLDFCNSSFILLIWTIWQHQKTGHLAPHF